MNAEEMKGRWTEFKGKARETWGKITDDDWDKIEGRREQIVGLVQQKYGRAKEEAEREVDDWFKRL